jgi:hypothetical protein
MQALHKFYKIFIKVHFKLLYIILSVKLKKIKLN